MLAPNSPTLPHSALRSLPRPQLRTLHPGWHVPGVREQAEDNLSPLGRRGLRPRPRLCVGGQVPRVQSQGVRAVPQGLQKVRGLRGGHGLQRRPQQVPAVVRAHRGCAAQRVAGAGPRRWWAPAAIRAQLPTCAPPPSRPTCAGQRQCGRLRGVRRQLEALHAVPCHIRGRDLELYRQARPLQGLRPARLHRLPPLGPLHGVRRRLPAQGWPLQGLRRRLRRLRHGRRKVRRC